MARAKKTRSYRPRAQAQWNRADAPWSGQGHALQTNTDSGTYFAWQNETEGPFFLGRVDEHGKEFGPVEVPDFVAARLVVAQADATDSGRPLNDVRLRALAASQYRSANRSANPSGDGKSFNADLKSEFLARGGIGAFIGAITGALLGGTPGILLGNAPVTSVGAHVGSIMGAATGAYVGGATKPRRPNPEPVSRIKKRLLR